MDEDAESNAKKVEGELSEAAKTEDAVDAKKSPAEPQPIPQLSSSDGKNSTADGGSGGDSGTGSSASGGGGGRRGRKAATDRQIAKPTVPDVYPQVMAIPIAKRPLFPGFYKAITIRDPNVTAAIQEMMKRGQPYVGAFLFKDETADKDVIEKMEDVHEVGVFAQVTSAFPVHGDEHSLTAVLYPHRRIKMSALMPPSREQTQGEGHGSSVVEIQPVKGKKPPVEGAVENKGDVVASFEELGKEQQPSQLAVYEPAAFLRKFPVSLVNVENLSEEPHEKKSDTIKALTSEIVNVFKEVAGLNPLFRDQISDFSISQSAGNVIEEPAKLADFAAAVSAGEVDELQDVLQTMSVEERLHKALVVLKKELMNAKLQSKISKDVESKIQNDNASTGSWNR